MSIDYIWEGSCPLMVVAIHIFQKSLKNLLHEFSVSCHLLTSWQVPQVIISEQDSKFLIVCPARCLTFIPLL